MNHHLCNNALIERQKKIAAKTNNNHSQLEILRQKQQVWPPVASMMKQIHSFQADPDIHGQGTRIRVNHQYTD